MLSSGAIFSLFWKLQEEWILTLLCCGWLDFPKILRKESCSQDSHWPKVTGSVDAGTLFWDPAEAYYCRALQSLITQIEFDRSLHHQAAGAGKWNWCGHQRGLLLFERYCLLVYFFLQIPVWRNFKWHGNTGMRQMSTRHSEAPDRKDRSPRGKELCFICSGLSCGIQLVFNR